jgi:hypothetical protein
VAAQRLSRHDEITGHVRDGAAALDHRTRATITRSDVVLRDEP